jgi:UDP-N-acetylglucosamine acyltransferase
VETNRTEIHPTAIVHPAARLGEGVQIGPYAVIEGAAEIGDRCVIQSHAIVTGHVVLGPDNIIGYGAVIGGDPQDLGFRAEMPSRVQIGARNRFREYCTIHRGAKPDTVTAIGDDCFLMAGAHVGHNARLGNRVILANNSLLAGHVIVEDNVFTGGGCVFHQHMRIGRLVMTQGLSKFGKDLPPFTVGAGKNGVAGLNVIGLRRAGIGAEQRKEIKAAFDLIYRSGLNTSQALAAAAERSWGAEAQEFVDFVAAAKKRGYCPLLHRGAAGDADGDE